MHFDQLLELNASDTLIIPGSWGQGRATFGGLVAALVFGRMSRAVPAGRPMRALQVSFVGPVAPDQPVTIDVKVLREGKAVSQVEGRLLQAGQVQLVVLGSFGAGRDSAVALAGPDAVAMASPAQCQALPYLPGVTPEFVKHIDMRWGLGALPFTGKGGRQMGGWMRFREPPEALRDEHLVALVDAWPPAVLPLLRQPAPASSLSWSLEVVHPRPALAADGWLRYLASIDQAGEGYGHTQATIWSEQGELVALSRQTVTVFA
ncbi:MAG: thioesterase family protein [Marinobacter sp.]|nr:thioesterase family protein [Marinobacter sp.]